jgi:hypothetical protein
MTPSRLFIASLALGLTLGLALIHYGQRIENPSARLILSPEWLQETQEARYEWEP